MSIPPICAPHGICFVCETISRAIARSCSPTSKTLSANYRLRCVPGIGKILALTILYEIYDVNRFERVQDFLSYSRLVKCAKESEDQALRHQLGALCARLRSQSGRAGRGVGIEPIFLLTFSAVARGVTIDHGVTVGLFRNQADNIGEHPQLVGSVWHSVTRIP
jgi:Transposase IS116/IS110/IS902 family